MIDRLTAPGWYFYNETRTTTEIVLALYQAIRDAAGPTYLIGCNVRGYLAVSLFKLNRTGDDTSNLE